MEVPGGHARTRVIIRGTVSPAHPGICGAEAVSRDVARVVSDVSVLFRPSLLSPTTGVWRDALMPGNRSMAGTGLPAGHESKELNLPLLSVRRPEPETRGRGAERDRPSCSSRRRTSPVGVASGRRRRCSRPPRREADELDATACHAAFGEQSVEEANEVTAGGDEGVSAGGARHRRIDATHVEHLAVHLESAVRIGSHP
jgi:hypothetical protein